MTLQRRLLHAMLGLLALAALAGVSTIFLPGGEFIARVAGTLFAAAIAIAIALPPSKKLSAQAERTSGLVSLLAIVIAFCLTIVSIWSEDLLSMYSWHLPVTTVAYVTCVIPALMFLSLYKTPGGRICSIGGLTFASLVFVAWLCAIWSDYFKVTNLTEEFFKTTGLFAAAALPVSGCLFGEVRDGNYWRWIGVASGLAAVALGLVGIWVVTGGEPTLIIHCIIVSAVVGGTNVLIRVPLPAGQRWLALATAGSLAATGLSGMYLNFIVGGSTYTQPDDISVRLLAASAIVMVCGVLAIVVLKAFNRRVVITDAVSINSIRSMVVHCPHCAKKQSAAMGESRCEDCGLIFLLKVAEPHCIKCNYELLNIRATRCPECGEPISAGPLGGEGR